MASTLTRQLRLFPTSGNTGTGDGNPLQSRIGYDLLQGVNNLHYTQPWTFHFASVTADGQHLGLSAGPLLDGYEVFAGQGPTVVPDGMKRLCWTLGFYAQSLEGDGDYVIDSVKIYLTPRLYTATTNVLEAPDVEDDTAFDVTNLGADYGLSVFDTPITLASLSIGKVYHFVDMSAGTTGPIVPFESKFDGGASWLNAVNLVVTVTAHRTSGTGILNLYLTSLSGCFLME